MQDWRPSEAFAFVMNGVVAREVSSHGKVRRSDFVFSKVIVANEHGGREGRRGPERVTAAV